jgi:hypothetical protein
MEPVKVLEPRVDVKHDLEKNHVVLYGGSRVTEQVNTADSYQLSPAQPTQALWTINPPSTQTICDRYFKVRAYVEVKTDQPHNLGTNDAPRQLPLSSIVETTTVQINGESISDNTADKLHAKWCYGNSREERGRSVSASPCMPDSYQEYSDWTTLGSAKNPLASYGENSAEPPRGGFPIQVVDATTFRCVVTEGLQLDPFLNGVGRQEEGMVNVNQINISLRFKADVSRFLSHSTAGNAITSVSVSFYQAPEMLTTFITPDLTQPIPEVQTLSYHKDLDYIKSVPTLTAGSQTTVVSDTIKLSQIPRRMYLFCRHSRGTSSYLTSDSFLSIQRLNILWNNQSGLFNSATQQDLFEISQRNGCNLDWPSWSKYRGSVLCIEFAKDIGVAPDEAPGTQGQYTIQITMDVKNESSDDFTADFYQVMEMEGTFSVYENGARSSLGNLTKEMVLSAKTAGQVDYQHYEGLQGGSFLSGLKSVVKKVAHGVESGVKTAMPFASVLAPEAMPFLQAASAGAKTAKKLTGSGLSGGRLQRRRR